MANNEIKLVIKIDGKDANAAILLTDKNIQELYKSFKYGQANVNGFTTTLARSLDNARVMIDGLRNVYSVLFNLFSPSISAALDAERATVKLSQALKNQGIYSESLLNDIKEYAAERQRLTGIDDDATVAIAAQFTAMGLQGEALRNAINSAQDLSAVMETDLNNAARLVGNAMKDGGEELSRYGFSLSQIRGQAEALAQDGIKKLQSNIDDANQTIGDGLRSAIDTVVGRLNTLFDVLQKFPPIVTQLSGTLGILSAAFFTLHSTGILPNLIDMNVLKNISERVALQIALAPAGVNALTLSFTKLQIAVKSVAQSLSALSLIGLIIVAAVELVNRWKIVFENMEAHNNRFAESVKKMADDVRNTMKELTDKQKVIRLEWEIGDAQEQLDTLKNKLSELEQWKGIMRDEEGIRKLKEQIKIQESVVGGNKKELESIDAKNKAIAASPKIQTEIEQKRAEAMNDGIKKRQALENAAHKKELDELKKRNDDQQLNDNDYKALREAAEKKHQHNLDKIKFDTFAAVIKLQEETKQKNIQRAGDSLTADLDLQEKQKLAVAKSEAEKEKIQKEFAEKRIQNERNVAVFVIDSQKKIVAAQITALQNSGGDPAKIKELQTALAQLDADKKAVNDNATRGVENLDAEETARNFQLKKELAEQYAQFQIEQDRNEYSRARTLEQQKFDAAKQRIEDSTLLEKEKDAALKQLDEEHLAASAKINEAEKMAKIAATVDALNYIGGAVAEHTVLGKAAAIASATMNTYEAATKALTAGPILGPIFAGIITGLGLVNVGKILGIAPPQVKKYAGGGWIKGRSHSEGGELIEAEKEEFIVNKTIATRHGSFLSALNAGVAYPVQNIIVQQSSSGDTGRIERAIQMLIKKIAKINNQIFINAETVPSKFSKAQKESDRYQEAFAL